MWTFIAGANAIGHCAASRTVVTISSAMPYSGFGNHVGAGGRDNDRIGGVGEADMADFGFLRQAEGISGDRIEAERLEGQRA